MNITAADARTFASIIGYPKTNVAAIAAVEAALPAVTGELVSLDYYRREVVYTGPAGQFRVEHAESGAHSLEHAYAALFAAGIA